MTRGSRFLQLGHGPQPLSPRTAALRPRIEGAEKTVSVCPYCAVGCSQLVYHRDNRVIDIEGNPDSPINGGTLCPKGAATYQLHVNDDRLQRVLYRAPYSDHWEARSLDWAMEHVARRIKQTRDAGWVDHDEAGVPVNHTEAVAQLGGATLDNEENYLIKKLLGGGLGVISIENQARI